MPAGVSRLTNQNTNVIVSNNGQIMTYANTGTTYHYVVWTPNAELTSFTPTKVLLSAGHTDTTRGGLVGALPDGTFVVNLREGGMLRAFRFWLDTDGPHWVPLPPPNADATTSLEARFIAEDGAIVTVTNAPAGQPILFKPLAGGYTPVPLDPLPNGNYATFVDTNERLRDVSGPDGSLYFFYNDPSATRIGFYRPTPTGYALTLLPTLSGGATAHTMAGMTGAGGPVARLSNHSSGASAVAYVPNGAGGWNEVLLTVPGGFPVSLMSPARGNRIIGNSSGFTQQATLWDLDGTSPALGRVLPGRTDYTNANITIQGFGGPYVVGYQAYQGPPVPLIWGPGIGSDPTAGGWGYVALPLPAGASWAIPTNVTADGFVVGFAQQNSTTHGVGWRPLGDGLWSVELLEYQGGPVAMYLERQNESWTSYYIGDTPNIVPQNLAGSMAPPTSRLIIDPTAAGGFRVVALPAGSNVWALSHAAKMIGGSLAGQPMIAFYEGATHRQLALPHTGVGGLVSDIFDGVIVGIVEQANGDLIATAWRNIAGDWTPYSLGISTAPYASPTQIGERAVMVMANDNVLVTTSNSAISIFHFDGAAYVESPLTVGTPGNGYYLMDSHGPPAGPSQHSLYPWTFESLRDGLALIQVIPAAAEPYLAVFGLPEAAGGPVPHVQLGPDRGNINGYTARGDFFISFESTFRVYRVTGNASASETIVLGTQSEMHTEYPDVYQRRPFVATYGNQTSYSFAYAPVADPAALDATIARVTGSAGSVFSKVQINHDTAARVWPVTGASVSGFKKYGDFQPFIWGCVARPAASFDAVAVRFRSNEPPTFTYQTAVADACDTTANAAIVVTTTTPQITTANDSSADSIVVQTTDVSVSLEASRRLVTAGNPLSYTATVYNAGPYAADGVVLTFAAPTQTGTLPQALNIGTLAAGATWSLDFPIATAAFADGINLSAGATVVSDGIDCSASNDSASATATISNLPNGYVRISAPATARVLEPFIISVTYGNDSDNDLFLADIAALLPPELTLLSGTLDRNDVDILTGTETTYDLEVIATGCGALDETLLSTATLTAATDVIPGDNAAAATTTLTAPAGQLTLMVTPDRAQVAPGGLVRWTATVRNDGVQPVSNVLITADVPVGTTYVPGSLTRGTTDGVTITAALPEDIQPGDSRVISFLTQATGAEGALLGGQADVSADGSCPTTAAYASSIIETPVLVINKSANRASACGDGPITWSITVANPGASAIDDVVVSDLVPAGTSYIGGSIAGGDTQTVTPGLLSWSVAQLGAGQGVTVQFSTTSPASHGTTVTNVANVSVSGAFVGSSNMASVAIDCDGGLTLSKSWNGDCQAPGDSAAITLTYGNSGAAPATGGVIVDIVPSALTPQLPVAGATWDAGTRTLTFLVASLPPGSASVTYGVDILASAPEGSLSLPAASLTVDGGDGAVSGNVNGAIFECNDDNVCTDDSCDPQTGCTNAPVTTGTTCDDDNDNCTVGACSDSGTCVEPAKDCDDDDVCTNDSCDIATGLCVNVGGVETCDGVDNDCDGTIDNIVPDVSCGVCALTTIAAHCEGNTLVPCETSQLSLGVIGSETLSLNILTCGDYSGGVDIGGAVAIGGTFELAGGFSVGFEAPLGDPDAHMVNPEVGEVMTIAYAGAIEFLPSASGQFYGNIVTVSPTTLQQGVGLVEGGVMLPDGDPLDLAAQCDDMKLRSQFICGASGTSNGAPPPIALVKWWGEYHVTAYQDGTNLFQIDAQSLSGSTTIIVDNPAGYDATVVINVVSAGGGDIVTLERGEVRLDDISAQSVLFNLCGVPELAMSIYGFKGSILAPYTDVTFDNGQIYGALGVGSMDGSAELHLAPFSSPLDIVSVTCPSTP